MDRFTSSDLESLVNAQPDIAVSIFIPMFRAGREVQQNSIRYKNAITAAEKQMAKQTDEATAKSLLQDQAKLASDDDYWQQQSDGLAIFISSERCERYRLPASFDAQVEVGKRFHVKPLLPLLANTGNFYIVAVSQNDVRLYEATEHTAGEIPAAALPNNLRDALNIDEYTSTLQHHSGQGGGQTAMFHGQGGSDPDVKKKDEILQFFHRLKEPLLKYIGDEKLPLVFAGVGFLFPIFEKAVPYGKLVNTPLQGNPERLSGDELREKAWPLVEPLFQKEEEEALERYHNTSATDLTSTELSEICKSASAGRVEFLLTAQDEFVWGNVGDDQSISVVDEPTAESEDLVNLAAIRTLANSGQVYLLPKERMPGNAIAAASFRHAKPK